MLSKNIPKEEKRKYKRIDTIFPVEFQILDQELNPISDWYQGFSQDISKGGICISANILVKDKPFNLTAQKTNLLLQIHSPISGRCFLAHAKAMWVKTIQKLPFTQFVAGVNFTKIDAKEINRLLNYVRFKKILWRTLQLLILSTLLFLALVVVNNFRLNVRNRSLLNKYSQLLHKDLELNQSYKDLIEEREKFDKELEDSKLELENLKESKKKIENSKNEEIALLEEELLEAKRVMIESEQDSILIKELEVKLEELKKAKDANAKKLEQEILSLKEKEKTLNNELSQILAKESEIKEKFSLFEEEEAILAEGFKNQLYNWLKAHQIKRSGLVVSFEGDYNLKDTSFIYDQALSVIAFTSFGDYQKAKRCLDFFLHKAERIDGGGFYNAYYSKGGETAEYIAHAGPNLWLGIAILQYTKMTKDYTYIRVARQIANWIESLQDKEGGIIGGKGISWYSTEHNLDGFAFFNMFYELTKERKYRDTANKIFSWLENYAYGNEIVPVNRGKGDSTIATDTYAWSIAALGPERLEGIKIDPDGILEFVIESCSVTTEFTDRFGKVISASGFDFAKHQHIPRGGVISCEWTAQMVLSFNIMSNYYFTRGQSKKAAYYQNQALKYLNELNKMAISSLSSFGRGDWCLPYASQENVDTGHGWRTPRGNRTGSVAATVYTIFAISEFNPLQLQDK